MRVLVQRVNSSSVTISGEEVGKIGKGLLLFVGFTEGDNEEKIDWMINKVINLRIFDDENLVPNLSVLDVKGEILSVSQFTLYGDAKKGCRPSYVHALNASDASNLYDKFNEKLRNYIKVETGVFQADMKVSILNDGPFTILLEK